MKKLIALVFFLFILYFGIQFAFNFFSKGYIVNYQIKQGNKTFDIEEIYTANTKGESDNYFLTIKIGNTKYTLRVFESFLKSDKIIRSIRYVESDGYKCLLPIFRDDKIVSDMMCLKGETLTYYHDIDGKYSKIDKFVDKIRLYNVEKWNDNLNNGSNQTNTSLYLNNVIDGYYLGVMNYSGIYTFSKDNLRTMYNNQIFYSDIVINKKLIASMVDKYYIIANYKAKYEFNNFILVDLVSDTKKEIISPRAISFDAYFQGTIGKSIYIFDPNSKRQYEINSKDMTVEEVGNADMGIKYYDNGSWDTLGASEFIKTKKTFKYYTSDKKFSGYVRVDKVGSDLSGNYYLYKKVGNKYNVYKVDVANQNQKVFAFTTTNLDYINYTGLYVYYIDGTGVKYYNDATGNKTVFTYKELGFNKNLGLFVYKK